MIVKQKMMFFSEPLSTPNKSFVMGIYCSIGWSGVSEMWPLLPKYTNYGVRNYVTADEVE